MLPGLMIGKSKLALVLLLFVSGVGGLFGSVLISTSPSTPTALPQATATPEPKKSEAPRLRTDRHGDPLPDGAIARLGTVRWRHGFFVRDLALSPDGKKIAAVGAGRAITLWDAATGKAIHQFPNRDQPNGVAFSPDGKMFATTDTPICRLWDVASGKELRQLKGHTNGLHGVAFVPDGKTLATAGYDGITPASGRRKPASNCDNWTVSRANCTPWPIRPMASCWPRRARTARSACGTQPRQKNDTG